MNFFIWNSGFNADSTNERFPCFVNIWRFWALDIVTFIIKDMLSFTSNLWLFEIYFFDYAQLQISAIVRLCPYWTSLSVQVLFVNKVKVIVKNTSYGMRLKYRLIAKHRLYSSTFLMHHYGNRGSRYVECYGKRTLQPKYPTIIQTLCLGLNSKNIEPKT